MKKEEVHIAMINDDFFKAIKNIKEESVDLFIIDPPYGNGYDIWDDIHFVNFTSHWVKECVKKLKKNGTMWIFMSRNHLFANKNQNVSKGLINILEEYGHVDMERWITWKRMKGRGSKLRPKSVAEEIIHFTKTNNFTWNNVEVLKEVIAPYTLNGRPRGWFTDENTGQRQRWTGLGNVWLYSSPMYKGILDKQRHSAQKPLLMIQRLVMLSSNPGDLVIDPFMGSGVTALVCKKEKRNFIGIEKDKKIYNETKNYIHKNYKIIEEVLNSDVQKANYKNNKGEKEDEC